jgi:hypothetical protein
VVAANFWECLLIYVVVHSLIKIIHQMSLIKGVIIIPAISKFTKVHDRTITCKCVTKLLLDLKPTKAAGPIN